MAFDYAQISGPKRRAKVLLRTRNLKMARNAHAYVRGSTVKFYEWLEDGGRKLPAGPSVWICGDCHLGNLGPLADADGHVDVQIRDLDQTVIGNPVHDLVRLALSLASAARGSDLPGVTTARMLEEMINGYETALAGRFGGQAEKNHRPKLIREILDRAVHRKWRQLAEERIENVKPSIPLGKRFWALTKGERKALKELLKSDAARELITALKGRREDDRIEVLDAAYWMKGCSSLGRLRYAVLVGVADGEPQSNNLCLIDIKEGVLAAAPRAGCEDAARQRRARRRGGARAFAELGGADDSRPPVRQKRHRAGVDAARPQDRDRAAQPGAGNGDRRVLGSRRRARACASDGWSDASKLESGIGPQPVEDARCAVVAVAERGRADGFA